MRFFKLQRLRLCKSLEHGISSSGYMPFASFFYFSSSDETPPFPHLSPQGVLSVGTCSSFLQFCPGHCAFVMVLTVVSPLGAASAPRFPGLLTREGSLVITLMVSLGEMHLTRAGSSHSTRTDRRPSHPASIHASLPKT